jgi:hypothetical protein
VFHHSRHTSAAHGETGVPHASSLGIASTSNSTSTAPIPIRPHPVSRESTPVSK